MTIFRYHHHHSLFRYNQIGAQLHEPHRVHKLSAWRLSRSRVSPMCRNRRTGASRRGNKTKPFPVGTSVTCNKLHNEVVMWEYPTYRWQLIACQLIRGTPPSPLPVSLPLRRLDSVLLMNLKRFFILNAVWALLPTATPPASHLPDSTACSCSSWCTYKILHLT